MDTVTKPRHIGRNISRIREMRDMKQEALAAAIGVSQQTISSIENSEVVEEGKLAEIAKALGVTPEAIENFSEETVFQIIGNTYHDHSSSLNYGCTFNPIDKVVELYERLVQVEKEKTGYLEKLLDLKS